MASLFQDGAYAVEEVGVASRSQTNGVQLVYRQQAVVSAGDAGKRVCGGSGQPKRRAHVRRLLQMGVYTVDPQRQNRPAACPRLRNRLVNQRTFTRASLSRDQRDALLIIKDVEYPPQFLPVHHLAADSHRLYSRHVRFSQFADRVGSGLPPRSFAKPAGLQMSPYLR